ncbi:MAG: carbamoyltransferase HypF [Chloroflexota bacterium]|nr:MAG: carbamoyltransferase HypF [Chloroflexota bacterium]
MRIHITGVVQGVGFRPFVYGLAQRLNLTGWVRNTSAGVDIEADGSPEALREFARALKSEAPPLALIDDIQVAERPANGFATFEIIHSTPIGGAFQPISPDVSICADCQRELFDETDRRFRYPFINCTNCGPRFTIVEDIPYDRPLTTMAPFDMCPECAAEYQDPLDRRFHAQPVACAVCGPHVWLEGEDQGSMIGDRWLGEEAILVARRILVEGRILAVKGLGGFHLACDAGNLEAVAELRQRKLRVDKPFAIMCPSVDVVARHCFLDDNERQLLKSRERPIVILRRRPDSSIASQVAPGQNTLGVMLPYTPLHYLLLEPAVEFPEALVMTSGNLSEEPIATENEEARRRLGGLADAFLLHNRGIRTRCDDSVTRVFAINSAETVVKSEAGRSDTASPSDYLYPLRRSRGYAPFPVRLSQNVPPVLAAGAELKNAFCLTNGRYAFLSHHIGDMENFETMQAFEDGVAHLERLFRVQPVALAYDLHPDYLATRYALDRSKAQSLPAVGVQHHHAHVAAAMAESGQNGDRPVIGVVFDGTGFGEDGAIWGGEFLVADYAGYERPYHLAYSSLPGGDKAIKQPWRMALTWVKQAGMEWEEWLPPVQYVREEGRATVDPLPVLKNQLKSGVNTPLTSSMGRLFDAVAALIGVRQEVNYEAQAAIELEAMVAPSFDGTYSLTTNGDQIDPTPMIQAIVADLKAGLPRETIAARFHASLALMVTRTCRRLRKRYGLSTVALSGGVWQNITLLRQTVSRLEAMGFAILIHRQVPANDGGLALGQAVVAANRLES